MIVFQHGWDGTATRQRDELIGEHALAALAPHFPLLRRGQSLVWHSPRPFSAAACVATEGGTLFIKRTDARIRDRDDMLVEHAFLRHLQARGLAVVCPLNSALTGSSILTGLGDGAPDWYEVFGAAAGLDSYRDVHSWQAPVFSHHSRALGGALAALHQHAGDFLAAGRPARPLLQQTDWLLSAGPEAAWSTLLQQRPLARAYLANSPDRLEQWFAWTRGWLDRACAALAELPSSWIHQDAHVSNVFWTGDSPQSEVASWIDFGGANRSWPVVDLAIAIERNCLAWLDLIEPARASMDIARPDHLRQLIAGYRARRELSDAERLALPALLPLCQLDFALSEIDYFLSVTHADDDARRARDHFLDAHLRWFASALGQAFLRTVTDALT